METSSYDRIEMVLFKGKEDAEKFLSKREMEAKKRWMLCLSMMIDDPAKLDKDIVTFLMDGCNGVCDKISQTTAYHDIASVKRLVGNIKMASKDWYRHLIVESAKKGIEIAITAKDPAGIAANIDKIGKYTRCDKEDEDIDRNSWQPPVFEPTDDVTLIGDGFKEIDNLEEERKSFRSKFKNDKDIIDIKPEPEDDGKNV